MRADDMPWTENNNPVAVLQYIQANGPLLGWPCISGAQGNTQCSYNFTTSGLSLTQPCWSDALCDPSNVREF